jgi:hypothetical protein
MSVHAAIREGNLVKLKKLLQGEGKENEVNTQGKSCRTGLHGFCALLSFSLLTVVFPGLAPIHVAVVENKILMIRALLRRGADVNALDPEGRNAIFLAAEVGQIKTLELLLKKKL